MRLSNMFKKVLGTITLMAVIVLMLAPLAFARPSDDYIGSPDENGRFFYYGSNYFQEELINSGLEDLNRIEDQFIPSVKREDKVPLWKGYGLSEYLFMAERYSTFGEVIKGNISIIIQGLYTVIGNLFFSASKWMTVASISVMEFSFSKNSLATAILDELPNWLDKIYTGGLSGNIISFIFFVVVIILGISLVFTFIRGQIVSTFTNLFISILFIGFFIIYLKYSPLIIKPIMNSFDGFTALSIAATENLDSEESLTLEESIFRLSDRLWNNTVGVIWSVGQFGTTDIEVLKLKDEELDYINTDLKLFKRIKLENVQLGFEKNGNKFTGDYYMDRVYLGGCSEVKDKLLEAISNNLGNRSGKELAPVFAVQPTTGTGLNHLFAGFFSIIPSLALMVFIFSVGFTIIVSEVMLIVMFLILPIMLIIAVAGETGRPVFMSYISNFIRFFMTKIALGFYLALVLSFLTMILLLIKNMSGGLQLGVIILVNTVVFVLGFWYRKKPLEMFLSLLSFSIPGSSARAFENVKGSGNMATALAGAVLLEKYRERKFGKMLEERKGTDETPPQDARQNTQEEEPTNKESLRNSSRNTPPTRTQGLHFDETKYGAKTGAENLSDWEGKMSSGNIRGAENILRKDTPNLKDANGATIPTKIGQMKNPKTREKAWAMFTRNKGDVNLKDSNGKTALHHTKTPWETSHIASAGANLEHKDNKGNTPLNDAIKQANPEKAQVLIMRGADLNTQNDLGQTPLMNAVEEKDITTAKNLVNNGADLTLKDNKGQTIEDYIKNDEDFKNILNKKPQ